MTLELLSKTAFRTGRGSFFPSRAKCSAAAIRMEAIGLRVNACMRRVTLSSSVFNTMQLINAQYWIIGFLFPSKRVKFGSTLSPRSSKASAASMISASGYCRLSRAIS